MSKHRIIVSAENTPYMEWQCKLFYFSCVTRLRLKPVIIVHNSGGNLCPGFYELAKAGCAVYAVPNYRTSPDGFDYPARNHPGSLIEAARRFSDDDGFLVLCDADLIFTGPIEFASATAAEFSFFMDYGSDFVVNAMTALGMEQEVVLRRVENLQCSVPYVIPASVAHRFGTTWLSSVEVFAVPRWENIMYAFGLALVRLGLTPEITHLAQTNHRQDAPVTRPIIHYAYGDDLWNKRNFQDERATAVWETRVKATAGSILEELMCQIEAAKQFYHDPYALKSSA